MAGVLRTSLLVRILILGGLPVAALSLWETDGSGRGAVEEMLTVQTIPVEMQSTYTVSNYHAGAIVSRRNSRMAFLRTGRVDAVNIDIGERVEVGQLLASLERRDAEAEQETREARLARAVANREVLVARSRVATQALARSLELHDRSVLSQEHHDQAVSDEAVVAAELKASEAAVQEARADLDAARLEVERCELHAPYAGTIARRAIDEGDVVRAGEVALEIIEDGSPEFQVGLPPAVVEHLAVGSIHSFEVNGKHATATLRSVVPRIERETRTLMAVFSPVGGSLGEWAPDGAMIRLELTREVPVRGAWLPLAALTEASRGLWAVYAVVEAAGVAGAAPVDVVERRVVEVLYMGEVEVFVRGALSDGDQIVATGVHRLVSRQPVVVQ